MKTDGKEGLDINLGGKKDVPACGRVMRGLRKGREEEREGRLKGDGYDQDVEGVEN